MEGLHRFQSHRLRKGRWSEPGRGYLITTTTRNRHPFFACFDMACTSARAIDHVAALGDHQNLCFVIMPDHIHWLLQLGPYHDLPTTVGMVKNLVSRRAGISVWQRGFHDHAVRDEEDIRGMARYIVANPIRAGLVKQVGDYPFWDAIWLDQGNSSVG